MLLNVVQIFHNFGPPSEHAKAKAKAKARIGLGARARG